MKLLTVIGARPQFVKAAVLSRKIKEYSNIEEIIVHTGQHYDENMSKIFFDDLNIPYPDYNLDVGSGSHGKQTGQMMVKLEEILQSEYPDWVIVYGDTNSTVAASLTAAKMNIPIAHVEAGLRSFNRSMPEEVNRIVTDHLSQVLFAPTQTAMNLLEKEGLASKSYLVGDIMFESVQYYQKNTNEDIVDRLKLPEVFYLATIHRPQNTDNPNHLRSIFSAFSEMDAPVVLPLHPRTKHIMQQLQIEIQNVIITDPVGYLDLLSLLKKCKKVLTDSGGLQKEAYFMKKQCVTLRTETEWTETLHNRWNYIVGADKRQILEKIAMPKADKYEHYFGKGDTSDLIFSIFNSEF